MKLPDVVEEAVGTACGIGLAGIFVGIMFAVIFAAYFAESRLLSAPAPARRE